MKPGQGRRLDARTGTWFGTAALVVALGAAAVIGALFMHARKDLTRDREFTLDPAVLSALKGLHDKVTVRVVLSKDLPEEFARVRARLVDALGEFEARSGGRIHLVFDNPDRDSLARVAALSLGIEEVVFREEARAGVKARKGFFGLAMIHRDRKELMPVVQSIETFEYDFVVNLKRLTGSLRTVGILEGAVPFQVRLPAEETARPASFDGQFSALRERLRALYRLETFRPAEKLPDVILVAAPDSISPADAAGLSRALSAGVPVLFLTPGAHVDLSAGIDVRPASESPMRSRPDSPLESLLAAYGVAVEPTLVIDPAHGEPVRFGAEPDPVAYPWWVRVSGDALNATNPATAPLGALTFPWTSGIRFVRLPQSSGKTDLRHEVLAAASPSAWAVSLDTVTTHSLYPDSLGAYFGMSARMSHSGSARPGWIPLAVLVTGREGRSAFRFVVISNALFVTDFYGGYADPEANLQFVSNLIDQLALDPGLIRMRSRPLSDAPLDPLRTDRLKPWLLGLNLLLAPALVLILWGFFALRSVRKQANAMQATVRQAQKGRP